MVLFRYSLVSCYDARSLCVVEGVRDAVTKKIVWVRRGDDCGVARVKRRKNVVNYVVVNDAIGHYGEI